MAATREHAAVQGEGINIVWAVDVGAVSPTTVRARIGDPRHPADTQRI